MFVFFSIGRKLCKLISAFIVYVFLTPDQLFAERIKKNPQ